MQLTRSTARRIVPVLALALGAAFLALPAQAEPEVTAQDVEKALHAAEVANEQVNQLGEDIKKTSQQIADLNAEIETAEQAFDVERDALGATIVQQQVDAPLGTTASLLGSGDPEAFIDGLGAVQALNSSRADQLDSFTQVKAELDNRKAQLQDRRASLKADRAAADEKKAEVEAKASEAQAALDRLSEPEQAAFTTSNTDTSDVQMPTGDVKADGRVQSAVDFALAQIGTPYVYGGIGPDGYDCSGLVMTSFAAAGISLPRVVGPQMAATQRIPMSQLQPGDLVAFGDMSHNGIYIGNGQVVHSPYPGKTVEITSVNIGFTVAGRVG